MAYQAAWLSDLNTEDIHFVKKFMLASGSLKEVAKHIGFPIPPYGCGWPGLILPFLYFTAAGVFTVLNLTHTFPAAQAFGIFLTDYGSPGLSAVVLKVGFWASPVGIYLILYFTGRHYYLKTHHPATCNKEYKKMLADDL